MDYKTINRYDYYQVAGESWPTYEDFQLGKDVPAFVYREIDLMITEPKNWDNRAFCILPFYGIELPTLSPCCYLKGSPSRKELQQEMLNGVRPKSCIKCWDLEESGFVSDRQLKNSSFSFLSNTNVQEIYNSCLKNENSLLHYKIDTSTVCNATCVTCNGDLSTKWLKLERANGDFSKQKKVINKSIIDEYVNYEKALLISFRGGEPTLSKTNFEILSNLIDVGNTNCQICFVTNGSFKFSQPQKDILKQFSNLSFDISIDGIGKVFDYMRYPLQWDTICENIKWCRENDFRVSSTYTISNLNLLYYKQTTDWFLENNIPYFINPVTDPAYYSPKSLPLHIKEKLKYQIPDVAHYFDNHHDIDDENFKLMIKDINRQDSWKKIKLVDFLPELYDLLF